MTGPDGNDVLELGIAFGAGSDILEPGMTFRDSGY